jgi:predicted AlkP superfamily pyrophosphatase or phosphodiesterase
VRLAAVALAATVGGCTVTDGPAIVPGDTDDTDDTRARKVLVVGMDGVRADGFDAADTPSLDAAFADGALTLQGSTQLTGVTVSGPGWASILTGVEVEDHGVIDNDHLLARSAAWPTFPERARAAGWSTGAVIHWAGVGVIAGPDAFDELVTVETDEGTGSGLRDMVAAGTHDVVFSHFDDVDHAGHSTGFSPDNPDYTAAIEAIDGFVAPTLELLAERADAEAWLVLLCTDHGGQGTSHGVPDAANRTIPLGVVGGGVRVVPVDANQMDVAATVLDWLDVEADGLDGKSWLPTR